MLLTLLEKYWLQIAIGLAVLSVLGYIEYLKNDIKENLATIEKLKVEKQQYADALNYQNQAIIANAQDVNKTKALPIVLTKIQTRYRTVYSAITQWRNNNEINDCNSSIMFINDFDYELGVR